MQTQLQTQNPKSSPVLPAGRNRPAAGLARTLCAAALLAGASVVWGQQTYTGPLELKFEPQTDGTLQAKGSRQPWEFRGASGGACVVAIMQAVRLSSAGKVMRASMTVIGGPTDYVKGDAYLRLKDNSQLRCGFDAVFKISTRSLGDDFCLKPENHVLMSGPEAKRNQAMKEGFTLVLTPKTFSCS